MGLDALALGTGEPGAAQLKTWLRAKSVQVFHGHAGIAWEGHGSIYTARAAGVPVVMSTEHLPYPIIEPDQRRDHDKLVSAVDRLILVSDEAHASFLAAGVPARKLHVVRNGIQPRRARRDSRLRARLACRPRRAWC